MTIQIFNACVDCKNLEICKVKEEYLEIVKTLENISKNCSTKFKIALTCPYYIAEKTYTGIRGVDRWSVANHSDLNKR